MDWDKDGKLDILSGCYWTDESDSGHIQILKGFGPLEFADAKSLEDAKGEPLRNYEFNDDTDTKQTLTICTEQHAVDYDGDGDLDLVVGCFASNFFLYENGGQDGAPALAKPVELSVKSPSFHSAPHLVDWDGDGDLDLLSGMANGGVVWSMNKGTRAKPEWAEFVELIPQAKKHQQSTTGGQQIEPSPSTRVWATDWNNDGMLDLLVGDCAHIVNPKAGIAEAEFAKLQKEFEEAMAEYQEKIMPVQQEYLKLLEEGLKQDDEEMIAIREKMQEASKDFQELYAKKAKFQDEQSTGFVWLYLQKDAETDVADAGG